MAKPIIDDELWTLIEPLLPPPKPRREKNPGRLPVSNRAALTGILFVLKTGLRWRDLPAEMGCGSGVTCWRRLRDWQAAGVWDRLHELLLAKLRAADQIDFSRAAVDSSSIRAVGAGQNWAKPHRSRATRFQAPHRHRRQRYAARRDPDRRERQRRHAIAAADRRDSADPRIAWPPIAAAACGLRGSRLRLRATSARVARSRYRASDRQAPYRTWQRPWQISLGRRTHACLAASLPSSPYSFRAPCRHSRRVPQTRLLSDLLEYPSAGRSVFMKPSLRTIHHHG